ncbi:MAG TPA: hypothetical protein VET90_04715, partial [Candidatus Binatus sp.]|nr:hypothetical protein [Candidatus Binatus sp.]
MRDDLPREPPPGNAPARDGAAHDGELVVSLPEPCLVVLVGAAGSGKTTLAGRLVEPNQVLSSDA